MTSTIFQRLGERDRLLLQRWALPETSRAATLRAWMAVTHLGGSTATLTCSIVPLASHGRWHSGAVLSLTILVVSHLVVQLVKRSVVRARPMAAVLGTIEVAAPDCFSFPSGHATAAMSVAFGYAMTLPELAAPLLTLAVLVGASRVALGVHYPGDVLAGQTIALLTGVVVVAW